MERKVPRRQSRHVGSRLTVRNPEDEVWLPYTCHVQAVNTSRVVTLGGRCQGYNQDPTDHTQVPPGLPKSSLERPPPQGLPLV